jgi:hypothetical protein
LKQFAAAFLRSSSSCKKQFFPDTFRCKSCKRPVTEVRNALLQH